MECPRCRAALPDVAHFCHQCGQDLRNADEARRKSFAVKPDEPVASLALVSTIMPRGAAGHPKTYQLALAIAAVLTIACAALGWMPFALMLAAFSIPVVYIVYLYDVNQWEDEPVLVTALAFGLTFVLGLVWTWVWHTYLQPREFFGVAGPSLWGVLLFALIVPVVGELIRQVGPVVLASRKEFDDLMDGLTFGVIAGVAYAAAETLVQNWDLLTNGFATGKVDPIQMGSLVFLHGFVKPLLYGTATGLAGAEFSGLGKGYDGFTPRYFLNVLWAILAVGAFMGGNYLLGHLDNRPVSFLLSILLGLVLTAVLILRIRTVLHVGLMEAAMESQARGVGVGATGDLEFCGGCEMPLLPGSAFCGNCGKSARAQGRAQRTPAMAGAPVAAPAGATTSPAPEAAAGTVPPAHAGDEYYDSEEGRA